MVFEIDLATCLIVVGCCDQYNRSIPRHIEGASWSNFPEEDANDHTPKEEGSLVDQLGMKLLGHAGK